MQNLYIILKNNTDDTSFKLLEQSAKKKAINTIPIFSESYDFSKKIEFKPGDLMYRIATSDRSALLEKLLINNIVTTFYSDLTSCVGKLDNVVEATILQEKSNLPIIKTIFSLTNDKKLLEQHSTILGGFPLIIRAVGGSHGVGIMKVDSLSSLFSVIDYLSKQNDSYILRQFIDYKAHARLIVLGDKVVASIEYSRRDNDIRSNVGKELSVSDRKFDKNIEEIAIEATKVLGFEFSGVDILIDKNGDPHIAEVNFPCFFPRAQNQTNIEVSDLMVDYLVNKSKSSIV